MSEAGPRPAWWRGVLREPLVHFAVAGALLLFAHQRLAPAPDAAESREIVVTAAHVDAFRRELQQRYRRAPAEEEVEKLVHDFVDEELLYREALALGLDEGDLVVRRRMAQKMQFLIEDTAPLEPATDAELQTYLDAHRADFDLPARLSFSHVFIARDIHAGETEALAARLRAQLLQRAATPADAQESGDGFPGGFTFEAMTEQELVRYFDASFAAAVMQLPPASWSQPIPSLHGLHIVWVTRQVPGQSAALDSVRERLTLAYDAERRDAANVRRLEQLRARYTIRIEGEALASAP